MITKLQGTEKLFFISKFCYQGSKNNKIQKKLEIGMMVKRKQLLLFIIYQISLYEFYCMNIT